jgi:hypothetical protein
LIFAAGCLILLAGFLFAVKVSADEENGIALCMEYFLEQFLYEDVVKEELFTYILFHRLFFLLVMLLNGIGLLRFHTKCWMIGLFLFLLSYGWGILLLRYHLKAVLFLVEMSMPQWIFFVAGLFFSGKMRVAWEMESSRKVLEYCGLCIFFFSVGVLTEATINPLFMKFLIDLL